MQRGPGTGHVLFLGFDAGNPALVREWAAEGHLPNFARLLAGGATATVDHEPGLYVGSIWPTTLTGVGVDRHGFYTGIRPAPYSYAYVPAGVEADPLWVDVARSGRRIAVVDAPFFPAVPGLDGIQLVEWGCHDRYHGPHSEPPELVSEVVHDVGRHPIGMVDHELGYERFAPCDWLCLTDRMRTPDDVVDLVGLLSSAVDHRTRMSKYLLDRGPFDLVVDIVAETHCAGHHLWSLHDPSHPDHDTDLVDRLGGDPLLAVYREMDSLLGTHLDALGDDGTAFVFLSHGMQSHFDGTHLLDELLWRLDCAYRGLPTPWVGPATDRAADLLARVPERLRSSVLGAVSPLVRRRLAPLAVDPTGPVTPPVPEERLWSMLENNTVTGAIRFNRSGREPSGLLSDTLTEHATRWLERELRSLVNLDGGGAVIHAVYSSDEHYARRDDDGLPDVLVEWNRDRPIERIWSPTIGVLVRPYEGVRTGDHDERGELVAMGPGIAPGRVGAIRPTDVAPTVAAVAGVFLPERDGRPVTGLMPSPRPDRRVDEAGAALDRVVPTRRHGRSDAVEATAVRRELVELRRRLQGLEAAHHETRQMAAADRARATVAADVLATTAWIRRQDVPVGPLISVVMPTRGRVTMIRDAVASVLAQTYPHLQLVVVDDGSTDGTAEWLAGLEDERVTVVRNDRPLGEGASRNRGLDHAAGELVAFLDDDNTHDPDWLRSAAWLFAEQPATEVAYGARVVDDVERHHGRPESGLPWIQLNEWDRETNALRSLVDVNVIVHRRGSVRFDPELIVYTDWDYVLGLTADTDPVRLPVVAAYYTTTAPDRATTTIGDLEPTMYARVRERWADRG